MLEVMSGGQSGVDRAALDAAIYCGIPYSGYVPKHGKCEDIPDGLLLQYYPKLTELSSTDYRERTRLNINSSDYTIIITKDGKVSSPGTKLTVKYCRAFGAPFNVFKADDVHRILTFMLNQKKANENYKYTSVNFAGTRESKSPGIHDTVKQTLITVFEQYLEKTNDD